MSPFKCLPVILLVLLFCPSLRTYADDGPTAEQSDWLPTLKEADDLLHEQETVQVDGKETEGIPNPKFTFPDTGTPIGETRLKIGDQFQLIGVLADGKPYTLERDEKARGTLVRFLSSTCGACLSELPLEKAYYVKFRDRGLRVVCVNVWDGPKTANTIIEKHKIPWNVVVDAQGKIEETVSVDRLPLLLLLNEDLQIVNATNTPAGKFALRTRDFSPPVVYSSNTIQSLDKLLPRNANKE